MIPVAKPIIGDEEKNAVLEVLESGHLAQGETVRRFEEEFANYCGTKYAVATSNGTTALHLAMIAHGIGEGDEVITTPFTFIASANSVLYTGARPVFVDIDDSTYNIDPDLIEAAITPKTRAIMPVHLYGNPADVVAIQDICHRYGLHLIEDAAQAHGAQVGDQRVGSFGTGCFSFYPTKNMTSGEGGMITTNDALIAEKATLLREHGARERYRHEMLAYNFRMTNIHAAIGLAQMGKIDGWTDARRQNARRLNELLGVAVVTPTSLAGHKHVYHQYTIRIRGGRGDAQRRLSEMGVGSGVHYPIPVPDQPMYREMGYENNCPKASAAANEVLSLPVHPLVTDDDLSRIAEAVKDVASNPDQ